MTKQEATQLAAGYAWGIEDTTGKLTPGPDNGSGSYAFSQAFSACQEEFNQERRWHMWPVKDAYQTWVKSHGTTCVPDYAAPVKVA